MPPSSLARALTPRTLDRTGATPLYRQLYERIRAAILSGRLAAGARLPSTRSLASQVAAARGTVDAAYALLAGEGYILGRGAAGTIVAPHLAAEPRQPVRRRGARPDAGPAHAYPPSDAPILPFQMGLPALDAFPRKLWSRLAARRGRALTSAGLLPGDSAGFAPLRHAIANYLAIARGIACDAEQVLVTAGFQGALGLIAQLLLRPGDAVWTEDPGYFRARHALALAGARVVPVPVDSDGLDVASGRARAAAARLAVLTPSHQFPLGMALALPRRLELLAWAEERQAFIVEDDYDSEFRYGGRPIPALKSIDTTGRVLYVGTFSKVLFPGLGLGYLVVPEGEIRRFRRGADLLHPGASLLAQTIVADFISTGHFARHIRRMRQLYGARRTALAEALAARFGARLGIALPSGGMHLIARLPASADDVALARRARIQGLAPEPLSAASIEATCGPGLLLGFTNIAAENAPREAQRLERAIG
jgi:GntR family transcriptional regulator/MocR family aminotransferase